MSTKGKDGGKKKVGEKRLVLKKTGAKEVLSPIIIKSKKIAARKRDILISACQLAWGSSVFLVIREQSVIAYVIWSAFTRPVTPGLGADPARPAHTSGV